MESGNYICKLCEKEYEPTKRGVQKFCKDKCRKKYNYHKKKTSTPKTPNLESREVTPIERETKENEGMSLSGVGNAAAGLLIIQMLTNFFTKFENKSATKADIQEIKNLINQRYFQIHKMDPRHDGTIPYFDMATHEIVYFEDPNYVNPADIIN